MSKFKACHRAPLLALAVFLILSLSGLVKVESEYDANVFLALLIIQVLVFVLPGLFYCRLNGGDYIKKLDFRISSASSLWLALLCSLIIFLGNALIKLSASYTDTGALAQTVRTDGVGASGAMFILLVYCVVPAITEEFVFRGIILNEYREYGVFVPVVMSSALFAMLHFSISDFPLYFFTGIMLSLTAVITRSVLIPMIVHFANNAAAIFLESYLWKIIERPDNIVLFVFVTVSLLLLLLYLYLSRAEYLIYTYALKEQSREPALTRIERLRAFMISLLSPSFLACMAYFAVSSVLALR